MLDSLLVNILLFSFDSLRAKNKEEELAEETPDFPHFLGPTKREALNIAQDLIRANKIKTAGSNSQENGS